MSAENVLCSIPLRMPHIRFDHVEPLPVPDSQTSKLPTCPFSTHNAFLPGFGMLYRFQTEDAYSSGHLVLTHFGTCMCFNVETNLSRTCLVSGLLSFEHPSVLLFCFKLSGMEDISFVYKKMTTFCLKYSK